jgi:RimJ/RimL family protein N-acetyltransferase
VSRSGPVSAGPVGWKVRLREVGPGDRRALMGFDRDSARGGSSQVGGYRHWAAHRLGAADAGDDVHFGIETLQGLLVGSMSTSGADPLSGRFSYGIGIASRHQRCGYASDAITLLLGHMFEQRGFRRCEVSVYGGNVASLSLHGALGFREVGRYRDTELVRGAARSLVVMRITAEEFAARHRAGTCRGRHWRPRRGKHWHDARQVWPSQMPRALRGLQAARVPG